jgi:predicted regulator of Ras-like GTPase activity (Roadblock/LC7/MglB family)
VKSTKKDAKFLQEIAPKPYGGSLIASKEVYGAPKPKSDDRSPIKQLTPISAAASIPETTIPQDNSDLKRQRLEEDMSEMLRVLSKKLKIPKEMKPKSKSIKGKKSKQKIPPANINEILKQLLNLDLHIEASAILKGDKILASAISSRLSETLLTTIGQNLTMIGSDIIEGLSGGKLKLISLKGTEGILDLAPIDLENPTMKDMILILFSHPKVKSGIINFAVNIVRKQIKEFLGINN